MEKVYLITSSDAKELAHIILSEISNQKQNPERLHSIAAASRLLGKSYSTICRMIKTGRIEATADGKNISQKAIDRYLTEKE